MRICRESLLTKAHGRSCCGRKGASAPFSCLPARTGSGRARKQVKGLVPCGFSGQRPEPSESFLMLRSAIFKVLLSLFFSARFFIDHLTLPYASIIDTFFSIVNHYFYHDNDYITNWEVSRNDKLFSIVGNYAPTGYLHLYTNS